MKENHKIKKKNKFQLFLYAFFCLCILAFGYIGFEAYTFLYIPPEQQAVSVEIEIEPGDTFDRVIWKLYKANIIKNVNYFRLLAKWQKQKPVIKAGTFAFSTNWIPDKVLHELVFGKPILYKLTIAEGLSWWQVTELVDRAGFAKAQDFIDIIFDQEFLKTKGILSVSAEGFLYPETYLLSKPKKIDKESAKKIAAMLIDMFWKKTTPLWSEANMRVTDFPEIMNKVILASLVEKETGVADERVLVAGVYINRLILGMPLQCDPTTLYGLGQNFMGSLRRSHLDDTANSYNTYQFVGLPPSPICSPGLKALQAALQPKEHDFLYFVATGESNGKHTFSKTLDEHNKAVIIYRKNLKKQTENKNK